jgi:hypothetical protein
MTAVPSRLEELLADRVLWGLDESEDRELANFGAKARAELTAYEVAGAAIIQAMLPPVTDEVPSHVLARLRANAQEFAADKTPPTVSEEGQRTEPGAFGAARSPDRPSSPILLWSGWVAAAAALILWVLGSTDRGAEAVPAAEQLAKMRRSEGVQRMDWDVGPEGEVVWSEREQTGFLVLRGLPANDPAQAQYQLWIFDRTRSDAHPVDGGVFDVPGTGEAVVPIDARVPVREAFGFAITREVPGGVVVSARGADGTGEIVAAAGL